MLNCIYYFYISDKKILIPTQSQKPWKNYLPSSEIWLLFTNKISITLKSFKNKSIIIKIKPQSYALNDNIW